MRQHGPQIDPDSERTLFDGLDLPEPPESKPERKLKRRKAAPPPEAPKYDISEQPPVRQSGNIADVLLERVDETGQMIFATRRVVLDPPKSFQELNEKYPVKGKMLSDVFRLELLFDRNHPIVTRDPKSWYASHVIKLSEEQVHAVALFAELLQGSDSELPTRMILQANTSGGKSVVGLLCAAFCHLYGKRFTFITTNRALVSQISKEAGRFLKLPEEGRLLVTGKTSPDARRAIYDQMRKGERDVHTIIGTVHTLANDLQDRLLMPKELGFVPTDEIQYLVGDHPYVTVSRFLRESENDLLTLSATTGPRRREIQNAFRIDAANYHVMRTPAMPRIYDPRPVSLPEPHREARRLLEEASELCVTEMIAASPRPDLARRIDANFFRKDGGFKVPTPEKLATMRLWLRERVEEAEEAGSPDRFSYGRMVSLIREFDHLQRLHMLVSQEGFRSLLEAITSETDGKADLQWVKRLYAPSEVSARIPFGDRQMKKLTELAQWHLHQTPALDHPKLPHLLELLKTSYVFQQGGRAIISVRHAYHGKELSQAVGEDAEYLMDEIYSQRARFIFEALKRDHDLAELGVSFVAGGKHMKHEEFDRQLEQFATGENRILVGTSVMREGIHIPRADWLIHWTPTANGGYLLQWQGRVGRLDTSGSGDIRQPMISTLYTADTLENWVFLAGERNKEKVEQENTSEDWG